MSKEKISSQEMVEQVASKLSVSKRVAEEFLKSLFAEIEATLLEGESVKIKNLGTFKMQWIEPRKSVNVQTGEIITIEGFNKITFTPDNELKEMINEPFSHLEAVELTGETLPDFKLNEANDPTDGSLRNLNEQASEIKNLLSEIQALSNQTETISDLAHQTASNELPDYDLILIDEETTSENDTIITDENKLTDEFTMISAQEEQAQTSSNTVENSEYQPYNEPTTTQNDESNQNTSNLINENKFNSETEKEVNALPAIVYQTPGKKRKGLKTILWVLFFILFISGTTSIYYANSSCFRCWVQYDLLSETNRSKFNESFDKFKAFFGVKPSESNEVKTTTTPIISTEPIKMEDATAVDSSKIQVSEPVDSFDIVFKKRRENYIYIGQETINEGTRLTNISQKYYGKKEFWVYIYEANRDNIVHPDRITPGTIVYVPKLHPKLIDKKNPKCLEKARELHDLYIGKK